MASSAGTAELINEKSPEEIEKMAASGAIQARCLKLLSTKARAGVTTEELDRAAEKFIRSRGGTPAFKGYHGYPGSICTSPNDMVVHGIPGPYVLKKGDILAIDVGVELDGWISDAAITVPIGNIDAKAAELLEVTKASLMDAVGVCWAGNQVGDIGDAVQTRVEEAGMSVVRDLIGHGVGRSMHEEPQVPNYGEPGTGHELVPGMVIAIEPMVTLGGPQVRLAPDNWAIFSTDKSLAAHFEFTVAITKQGPRILTPWHELLD